jgi:hypothetical protein
VRRVLLLIVVFLAGIGAACQGAPGLDPAFTRQTVETVAGTVEREYFDPSAGRRFAAMITAGLEAGRYASHATVDALAAALTRDLFDASGDKHLAVLVVRPPASGPVVADRETERATQGRRTNFGVQRIEILPGNIGYLNLTAFYRPEEAGVAFGAASGLLAGADVLILDLRQNSGGSPEMVALVAGTQRTAPPLRGGTELAPCMC